MKRLIKTFSARDGLGPDAKEVYKGIAEDVAFKIGCSSSQIYHKADRGLPIYGFYIFTDESSVEREARKTGPKKKTDDDRKKERSKKNKERYEMFLRMLDIYGNTGCKDNPYKVFGEDAFARDGYLVKIEHKPRRIIRSLTSDKHEIWDELWLITLIKKVEVKK